MATQWRTVSTVLCEPVAWVGPAGMSVRVCVCECARAMSVHMVRGWAQMKVREYANEDARAMSKILREPVALMGPAEMSMRVLVREDHVGARAWPCRCACMAT